MHVRTYIFMHLNIFIYMHIFMHTFAFICAHIFYFTYMFVCYYLSSISLGPYLCASVLQSMGNQADSSLIQGIHLMYQRSREELIDGHGPRSAQAPPAPAPVSVCVCVCVCVCV